MTIAATASWSNNPASVSSLDDAPLRNAPRDASQFNQGDRETQARLVAVLRRVDRPLRAGLESQAHHLVKDSVLVHDLSLHAWHINRALVRRTVSPGSEHDALEALVGRLRTVVAATEALRAKATASVWTKVSRALSDEQWDFRTIEGIARETALPAEDVRESLKQNRAQLRIAPILDPQGRTLYAIKSRPRTFRDLLWEIQACISKSL